MDKFRIKPSLENEVSLKEWNHIVNYCDRDINLKGFDGFTLVEKTTVDDIENITMTTQTFRIVLFYSPCKNIHLDVIVYRAKSWSCINTQSKIIEVVEL